MAEIVLAALNAKYIHTAFGLRCLMANLGPLRERAALLEFDIKQRPMDVAAAILDRKPRVVGMGVYIWNLLPATMTARLVKTLRPETILVLGGPEVSHPPAPEEIADLADYILQGEADLAFAELCRELLAGRRPPERLLQCAPPPLEQLALPYDLYAEEDLRSRVVYAELSRGCPYRCEFCLSSLDRTVRLFPQQKVFTALDRLFERGLRAVKFADRTLNWRTDFAVRALDRLLPWARRGARAHFELFPRRLPPPLRQALRQWPPDALELEVGVQTFNPETLRRIGRRQDPAIVEETLRFLREETGARLHADLIFGLPGEDLESFARSFDRLLTCRPQEIQVGVLKRLRGAPIARHDAEWEMTYSPYPPYEILRNRLVDFELTRRLLAFARYWDLIYNSGNFRESGPMLWRGSRSAFAAFLEFSDWLGARFGRRHAISLHALMEAAFAYLVEIRRLPVEEAAAALARDYLRPGRRDPPPFLREHLAPSLAPSRRRRPRRRRKPPCEERD